MLRQAYVWMAVLLMWLLPVATPAKDMNLIVTLDRADLQRRIDRMFPITREAELLTVHLHHPRVILHEHSNRIGLRLRLDASVAEQFSVSGSARIDGVLRFASDSGKFYLDHASLKEMQIDGVPSLYLAQVQQLADGVVRDLQVEAPGEFRVTGAEAMLRRLGLADTLPAPAVKPCGCD